MKGSLASPLGETASADKLQQDRGATKDAALARSTMVLDQAEARLMGTVVRVPSVPPTASNHPATGTQAAVTSDQQSRPAPHSGRVLVHELLREAAMYVDGILSLAAFSNALNLFHDNLTEVGHNPRLTWSALRWICCDSGRSVAASPSQHWPQSHS